MAEPERTSGKVDELFRSRMVIQKLDISTIDVVQIIVYRNKLEGAFYPKLNEFLREFIEENKIIDEIEKYPIEFGNYKKNILIADEIDQYALSIKNILQPYKQQHDLWDNPEKFHFREMIGNINKEYISSVLKLKEFNTIKDLLDKIGKLLQSMTNNTSVYRLPHKVEQYYNSKKYLQYGVMISLNQSEYDIVKQLRFNYVIVDDIWLGHVNLFIPIE